MSELRLMKVAEAQMSQAMLERLQPFMDRQEKSIIGLMKAQYRAGDMDGGKIFAKLGELVALENLQNQLKAKINQGARAQKETHENEE